MFAGEIYFIFPAWLVRGYYSILCSRTDWEEEAGRGRNVAATEKEKGLTHPTSSPMRLEEDDQEHHTDLSAPAVLVFLP